MYNLHKLHKLLLFQCVTCTYFSLVTSSIYNKIEEIAVNRFYYKIKKNNC
jgi:hypothetical protein